MMGVIVHRFTTLTYLMQSDEKGPWITSAASYECDGVNEGGREADQTADSQTDGGGFASENVACAQASQPISCITIITQTCYL